MTVDGNVSLSVENFGFIETGNVELRPLTILTGESNVGKSWFATLVYALNSFTYGSKYRPSRRLIDYKLLEEDNSPEFVEDKDLWIEKLETGNTIELKEEEAEVLQSYLNSQSKLLKKEINRCFGNTKFSKLIRTNSNQQITVKVEGQRSNSTSSFASIELNATKNEVKYNVRFPRKIAFSENEDFYRKRIIRHLKRMRDDDTTYHKRFIFDDLLGLFNKKFLNTSGAIYFPAGRVGLINNIRSIVSSVLQQEAEADDENNIFRPVSGVNTDFLVSLINARQLENSESSNNFYSRLEKNLLQGRIVVKNDPFNIPYFYYQSENESDPIPLNMSSSMVSQLASIVLLLRSYGRKKRLLILEEPEAHLHPSQQVLLVNEICRWVKAGYRVLLTTHSEWLIEAVRNVLTGNAGNSNPVLRPDQVGVWNFHYNSKKTGSVITEVEWDLDFGGFQAGFEETAQLLHNDWVDANRRVE